MTNLKQLGKRNMADHLGSTSRLMLAIDDKPCPFACTYCFARFQNYPGAPRLEDLLDQGGLSECVEVVYPACDTDLFARQDSIDVLEKAVALGASISLSTKAVIPHRKRIEVQRLTGILAARGKVLKIGVSITTKYICDRLEPRVPSYSSRIRMIRLLCDLDIPRALVLRPLHIDVPTVEYEEIIREASAYTNIVLFGDEWLPPVGQNIVESSTAVSVEPERVNWISGEPVWLKRSVPGRIETLSKFARSLGMTAFESDIDLMRHLSRTLFEVRRG